MKLGKAELVECGQEVRIRAAVEREGRKEYLWYAVERCYAHFLTTDRLDPFVVGLLLPAMMAGEDMRVEGPMSEKLHWNLTHYYMRIMTTVNPRLHAVRILPTELNDDRPTPEPTAVGTGFSGGIDSFCVLADHLFDEAPPAYKVTHLIFNNVGSHSRGGQKLFQDRYERLRPCAERLNVPFIRIDSNLNDFYQISFGESDSPRNISAALTLQGLFRRYLYASSVKYEDCAVGKGTLPCFVEPMAIHLLSTEATECTSTGSQYSRVEKTAKVAEIPLSYDYLDVCFDRTGSQSVGNCSTCKKCVRTLLTLELLGKAHLYEKVFSLDRYRAARRHFMVKAIASELPLMREIVQLARTRGYSFPLEARILGTSQKITKRVKERLRWRHN